ncbi:MAG: DNA repair exonuclease [Chloroflexota bacterium]|nr:DNA repair exonuclease [Chloroflexota bacterium]
MPRLLHMADVHLGARHHDLGEAAVQQRERQFAAFRRALDVAIDEGVDLVLVAGDLFDSNHQPRRLVERVANEFRRLVLNGVPAVVLPGTHDVYDQASIYRTYDLPALAGLQAGSDALTVLTPDRVEAVYPALDLVVHGRCFPTKRAPASPLAGFSIGHGAQWHVGLVHGSLRIPGRVEQDDVLFTEEEVAVCGLDYLALGHWHSARSGRAGPTTWAYAGAVEPMAVDQEGAGAVALVTLEEVDGERRVLLERRRVGRTKFRRLDLDASEVPSQGRLVDRLRALADPDLVLEVRLTGIEPDTLDLNDDEVAQLLGGAFFRYRIRNATVPPPLEGPRPPADTIAGAFVEDLERKIQAAEDAGRHEAAADLRESLRLGRLLLEDPNAVQLA